MRGRSFVMVYDFDLVRVSFETRGGRQHNIVLINIQSTTTLSHKSITVTQVQLRGVREI